MQSVEILFQKAVAVRLNAYAPYSNYLVGACLESQQNNLYVGCNVENAAYGLTLCAEANAISAMVGAGDDRIQQIAVVLAGPQVACCGACRQRLFEFSNKDTLIHLCDLSGPKETYTLGELLPHAFGPETLK